MDNECIQVKNINVSVHVYSPDIPVSLVQFTSLLLKHTFL